MEITVTPDAAPIEVTLADRFDSRLTTAIADAAADLPLNVAYADWIRAVHESGPGDFRLNVLTVERGGEPLGVLIAFQTPVDLTRYASDGLARGMRALRRIGLCSFRTSIGFLAVPFSTGPGLLCRASVSEEDKAAIYRKAVQLLLDRSRTPVFMVRSEPSEIVRRALQSLGFLPQRLDLPDAVLDLGYRTFDEYVATRDRKMRYKIRSEMKTFSAAGGSVEILTEPERHLADIWRLHRSTLTHHRDRGDGGPPIEITEDFFRAVLAAPSGRFHVLMARTGDRPVGFFLLIHARDCLFVRHAGLDYQVSVATKTYFNLWYAAIRHAIERGFRRMFMGTTSYFVKVQLGARLYPMDIHFYFRHKWIGERVASRRLRDHRLDLPAGVSRDSIEATR